MSPKKFIVLYREQQKRFDEEAKKKASEKKVPKK